MYSCRWRSQDLATVIVSPQQLQDLSPKTVPPAHSRMLMAQELLFLVDFVIHKNNFSKFIFFIEINFNICKDDTKCNVCANTQFDHLCLYFETELCGATQACPMESEDRGRTQNSRFPENTSGYIPTEPHWCAPHTKPDFHAGVYIFQIPQDTFPLIAMQGCIFFQRPGEYLRIHSHQAAPFCTPYKAKLV